VHDTGEVTSTTTTATVSTAPRSVRWYSVGLAVGAVVAGCTLLAVGSPSPALGPVLLLAIAAACCVNRFTLFPSEHAATAEAAVVLAAVVGFRSDAAYLGPLIVALLAGPLDTLHWEQRSFVRMAYNAGNRGWSALAAAGAFAGARETIGSSTIGWVVAVVLGAAAFAFVDVALSAILLRLHGDGFVVAVRHVLDVDVLTMPVALVGAAAGILALEVGWWATVLALLPAAFAPELVLARARSRAPAVRDLAALLCVIAVLATVALVTPVPDTASLAILCVFALVLGIGIAPNRKALVPPLLAIVVMSACTMLDGDRMRIGAVVVAVVTTATSWWCERRVSRPRVLAALAVAAGASTVAAQLALELPRTSNGLAVSALVAGVAFELLTLSASPSRRRRGTELAWLLPVLAVAVCGGVLWRSAGDVGAIALLALVTTTLIAWVGWGAPAWSSRIAARVASTVSSSLWIAALAAASIAAVAATAVGASMRDQSPALAWAWVGAGLGELAIAMVAAGVRQWRFAPWPRRWSFACVELAAIALVGAGAPLAADGSAWGTVVVGATMLVVLLVARAPARRLRAMPARDDVGVR
jgi:hypothetical protein